MIDAVAEAAEIDKAVWARSARSRGNGESPRRGRLGSWQAAPDRRRRSRWPQGRRGPGAHRRHRRLSHRRLHALGRRSRGRLPLHPRSRGRRRGGGDRPGRHHRQARRSRHPALHARVRPLRVLPLGEDQPVPGHPRHAGTRPDARRDQPLQERRQDDLPLHGHQHVLRVHGAARDRARRGQQGGAAREGLPARLRHHHRHRRGAQHRQGRARARRSPCSGSAASDSRWCRAR